MANTLTTQNLILYSPRLEDLSAIIDFEARNSNHLKIWETSTSVNDDYFNTQKKLENWIKECEEGKSARLHFNVEGYARNYLFINDRWEDHVLTALSFEAWQQHQNPSDEKG